MMPQLVPVTSHDQNKVAPYFDNIDQMNAVVPMMMSVPHGTSAGASGII